jgi:CRISPR-associated protein Cmr3
MKYKITLKPLDKFFFGGENSFKEATDSDRDRRATYLLKSRYYPQQTSLLGLVRNQLLLQNDLLADNSGLVMDKAGATLLIGAHGFELDYDGKYGAITSIGACYLSNQSDAIWLPGPLDDFKYDNGKIVTLKGSDGDYFLEHYSDKNGKSERLQCIGRESIESGTAFTSNERVGITKAAKPWVVTDGAPEDEEAGYYYQTYMRFATNHASAHAPDRFAFYVEFNQDVTFNSGVVEMGGERSSFYMEVTKVDAMPKLPAVAYEHTQGMNQLKQLVCLSPALVDLPALRASAKLLSTETITFRFLKSRVAETTDYQRLTQHGGVQKPGKTSLKESALGTLLERGSVVHFLEQDQEDIETLFTKHADLCNIGYNQYCII